jgi:hypothetical protein
MRTDKLTASETRPKYDDTEVLNMVEDFLTNNVTSDPDEPIAGSEAVDMLLELREIVRQREKADVAR